MHGGDIIADVLKSRGVPFLYTLCGGHISPILVGCKQRGIRVIDVRHEVTTVFAADATARLTGIPGVAAVTAGPGATNTITAVKNAQMAQSPIILLGGATATILKGRGSLQDVDQISLFKPHVKWATSVKRVRDLRPVMEKAFDIALGNKVGSRGDTHGVPGPVFVECPLDLLYEEPLVRQLYGISDQARNLSERATNFYLSRHVNRLFAGAAPTAESQNAEDSAAKTSKSRPRQVLDNLKGRVEGTKQQISNTVPAVLKSPVVNVPAQLMKTRRIRQRKIQRATNKIQKAKHPVMLVGSQTLLNVSEVNALVKAVEQLNIPVYLSGMARGMLGTDHPLHMRHKRRDALKEADLVILAGVPCDFRLNYGRHIPRRAYYISVNRSRTDLRKNRRPNLAVLGDPSEFLRRVADQVEKEALLPRAEGLSATRTAWLEQLQARDQTRENEIYRQSLQPVKPHKQESRINPVHLCRELEKVTAPRTILIGDGGDFVGTASYIVKPSGPLRWLDPGPFGTLGVGAGFALAAKLCHPEAEVWILYGDGAAGYSINEFDTFVRHNLNILAVVGNDAGWTQIAREQVEMLHDDVGTVLNYTDYHRVVDGFGGRGFTVSDPELVNDVLFEAKFAAQGGKPVLVNALIGKTDFRKGSISI